jgi:hypothetical protein
MLLWSWDVAVAAIVDADVDVIVAGAIAML